MSHKITLTQTVMANVVCNAVCYINVWGFLGGSVVKNPLANAGDTGSIPGGEDPQEEEMATHSSFLAWEIPWREKPGGLVHGVTKSQTQLSN